MALYIQAKNILWIAIILIIAPFCITILKEEYGGFFNSESKVGILTINGPITESTTCIKELNAFFKDPMIKGIILNIECNEGRPGSAQLIYQEIEYLKKEFPKPIITLVENVCTAEGYLIASATDTIIAPSTALVGGIYPTIKNLISSKVPENARKGSDSTQIPDGNTIITPHQKIVEDIYTTVMSAIAHRRKLALKDHELWGNGAIFTGHQALKLHLIDQVGCVADARNNIKEKALIDGQAQWVYSTQKKYALEWIKNLIE